MAATSTIAWIFRTAVAMEFVGHGAFGILTKAAWVPYFAVPGIPEAWAWRLMPIVGTVDIVLGVLTLLRPMRLVLLHMAFWGFMTACLRPLAGEGIWELLERGYNYGVPLAFLIAAGAPARPRDWVAPIALRPTPASRAAAATVLRWAIALSLVGHGGVALFTHQRWTVYFAPFGLAADGATAAAALAGVAWLEVALGVLVLLAPRDPVLLAVCAWKLGTEMLRLPAGEPVWEVIERGGAYAAPILLILLKRPETIGEVLPWRRMTVSEPTGSRSRVS
jgi:hypothetical protein